MLYMLNSKFGVVLPYILFSSVAPELTKDHNQENVRFIDDVVQAILPDERENLELLCENIHRHPVDGNEKKSEI